MKHAGRRAGITATVVVLAITMLATACGKSSNSSSPTSTTGGSSGAKSVSLPDEGTPTTGGKMVIGTTGETNGWNPATAQWADSGSFVGSSFLEPLGVFDREGNVVPWVAESWAPSDNNQTWTIKIRDGITFQDGTPLTSADVAADWKFAATEGLTSVVFGGIITDVEAIDSRSVAIHLTLPWAVFPTVFGGGSAYVMPQSMLEAPDHGERSPVGTGPYKFQSWIPDKSLTVVKYDGYWGGPCAVKDPSADVKNLCAEAGVPEGQKNGPFLDQMEFRPIPDPQERDNALKAGDVNLIESISAASAASFDQGFQVVKDYDSEQILVNLNTGKPPFDNIHARKALAYATDRQAIVDRVDNGQGVKSDTSPFEESSPWGGKAPDQTGYPQHDVEKAKQEVAAYTADTGQPLKFSVLGVATVDGQADVQQLQEQWRQVGIETTVDTIEQAAFITKLVGGEFQAAYFRNYGYPEPDFDYVFWSKKTAQPPLFINFSQWYNDVTENALATGRTSADHQVRQDAYDSLIRERNGQALEIWLYDTPNSLIADKNVRGLNWFRALPFGNYDPKPWIGGLWRTS